MVTHPDSTATKARRPKHIPGIRPRGNKWIVRAMYRHQQIFETARTREMAIRILEKFKEDVDEDRFVPGKKRSSDITIENAVAQFLEHCRKREVKTLGRMISFGKALCSGFGPDRKAASITSHDIENFLLEYPKKVMANRTISFTGTMYQWLIRKGELSSNPVRGVKKLKEPGGRIRYLSPDEEKRLLDVAKDELRKAILISINTGLRKGELMRMRWSDVDFLAGVITIVDQKSGGNGTVPMNETVRATLRTVRRIVGRDKVFHTSFGSRWIMALREAKIENFHWHDMRHTFASNLAMRGVPLKTIQTLMRHKTILMTMRYSHLSEEHLYDAVNRLLEVKTC